MYLCILDADGNILLHRNMKTSPDAFLKAVAPFRDDLVVCVECMFTWYWIADLCAKEKIEFVLGHALYMKAIHGGKAKTDKIDSHKIAVLLRGGMLPQSYVYPADWRSTRDLLRRRIYVVRKRSELLAHMQNTVSQYNLDPIEDPMNSKSITDTASSHFGEKPVRMSIELDSSLVLHMNQVLGKVEYHLRKQAEKHDYDSYHRLRSVPGIGEILALVIMYEIHDIRRFASVQDFVSYSRLVKCAKESAGKKSGISGAKMGNAYLKWAFGEAAVIYTRCSERGKLVLAKLENKHGKGKAYSIFAQKLGRAVYYMLKRKEAFNEDKFMTT